MLKYFTTWGPWEELPPQVDVVGDSVFQIRIAFFLVFFVDDAVGDNLEETRPVDCAGVAEPQVHSVGQDTLDVQARQIVGVFLTAVGVYVAREFKGISLAGVFNTQSGYNFPVRQRQSGHAVACGYFLIGIIVERIADVAEFPWSDENSVEVVPVLPENLDVSGSGCGVECIFVEKAVALFVAVHSSEREVPLSDAVSESE